VIDVAHLGRERRRGGDGGGTVDVTGLARDHEHHVGFGRVEALLEQGVGAGALGPGVAEAVVLQHAEGAGADDGGDDHEQDRHRQHEASTTDGEAAETGEHGNLLASGSERPPVDRRLTGCGRASADGLVTGPSRRTLPARQAGPWSGRDGSTVRCPRRATVPRVAT
jgi:hypothetical protein